MYVSLIHFAAWRECVDTNTGYPYYWNTKTNEVVWEEPAEVRRRRLQREREAERDPNRQRITSWPITNPNSNSGSTTAKKKPSSTAATTASASSSQPKRKAEMAAAVVFGPSLPEPKPEEIAMQKIKKFEQQFALRLVAEVEVRLLCMTLHTLPCACLVVPP